MIDWSAFDTNSLVIKRRPAPDQAVAVVMTIAADVQTPDGKIAYYDPSGAVQKVDALVSIDYVGAIPDIRLDDIAVVDGGDSFNVVHVESWTFPPAHLELRLQRGPIARKQTD
jgi:hypothetical protein